MSAYLTIGLFLAVALAGEPSPDVRPCSSPASCLMVAAADPSDTGIQNLEYAFSKWPNAHGVAEMYGERLLMARRFGHAVTAFSACINHQDVNIATNCRVGQAIAFANLGRHAAADALLTMPADSAIAKNLYSPAIGWRAHVLIDLGEFPKAAALIEKGHKLARSPESRATLFLEEARLALAKGDGATALREIHASIEITATPEYRLAFAVILAWMGRFDEALDEIATMGESGLAISTRDIPDLLRKAIVGIGETDGFSRQISNHPTEQIGWFCASLNQYSLGNSNEAMLLLEQGRRASISTTALRPTWAPAEKDK